MLDPIDQRLAMRYMRTLVDQWRNPLTDTVSTDGTYSADPNYPLEHRRLDLLAQMLDGWTQTNLERIGVSAGWRCLEVGAGSGTVATWMADRVGPDGACVAIDIDVRFLDDAAASGVEVLQRNVLRDELPEQSFDLIHTRVVVTHLPDPDVAIKRMVRWLRPGGHLLLEELDGLVARDAGDPVWRHFWTAVTDFRGFDVNLGRSLPARLAAAGLVDVTADGWLPIVRGGTAQARFYQMATRAFGPAVIDAEIMTQADLDDLVRRIDQPDFLEFGPMWIGCSGRRPG